MGVSTLSVVYVMPSRKTCAAADTRVAICMSSCQTTTRVVAARTLALPFRGVNVRVATVAGTRMNQLHPAVQKLAAIFREDCAPVAMLVSTRTDESAAI